MKNVEKISSPHPEIPETKIHDRKLAIRKVTKIQQKALYPPGLSDLRKWLEK